MQDGKILAGGTDSLYASATIDSSSKTLIVKPVNVSGKAVSYTVGTDARLMKGMATLQVLLAPGKSYHQLFQRAFCHRTCREIGKAAGRKDCYAPGTYVGKCVTAKDELKFV